MIDKRLAESDFHMTNELLKGVNVAKDAKAMRLNRRIMYKNAPLQDAYEPVMTTKQVNRSVMKPEVDLDCLKMSFKSNLGR